jgi:hypothetical protein
VLKTIVTKGEYAEMKGRSAGTISHWLADGKISAAALVGQGHHARIWVEQADADLTRSLDPGQQAAQERPIESASAPVIESAPLDAQRPAPPPANADRPATDDQALRRRRIADAEKAEYEAEAARRKLAIDEGRWVDAAAAQREWAAELTKVVSETETYLTNTLAREIADELRCDWKVLAARIRDGYRGFRATVSDEAARRNAGLQAAVAEDSEATT